MSRLGLLIPLIAILYASSLLTLSLLQSGVGGGRPFKFESIAIAWDEDLQGDRWSSPTDDEEVRGVTQLGAIVELNPLREYWTAYHRLVLPIAVGIFLWSFSVWSLVTIRNEAERLPRNLSVTREQAG